MPRPKKWRRVCGLPQSNLFAPLPVNTGCTMEMTIDEYETLRLIDYEGLNQEACAEQMGVARTTVQAVYASARKKVAISLVEGRILHICGGDVKICEHAAQNGGRGCGKHCRMRCCKEGKQE